MKLAHILIPLCLAALAGPTLAAPAAPYAVTRRLPFGGDGGWDYPSVDRHSHRLYLSRGDRVSVVDTRNGKLLAEIGDTPGVHGIALAPELGRGYISAGKANQVKVFDLHSNAVLATVATGDGPDAIVYEPLSRRVLALNGRGHSATLIDTANNTVVATLPLGGKPEFARADGRGRIYVNIEDTAELVAIDAASASLLGRWPLQGCEEPTGLALDTTHRRSFSTCGNQVLAVLDLDSGRAVAAVPIGKGVDGAEFDPSRQTLFSANGEGTLTVVLERGPEDFVVLQTLPTQRGARTITLDPVTHRLYLPTAEFGPTPAPSADNPHPRAPPLPGSFTVLEVAQTKGR
jgi:DNA-binding beta-propeller fold protein YncE